MIGVTISSTQARSRAERTGMTAASPDRRKGRKDILPALMVIRKAEL
jgi:hypothetical protein